MNIQFVKEIPKGFTHIKGMREPYYGDNNEIIGFRELGNGEADSRIVVVRGKEKQLKKYHKQVYEQIQDWLEKSETRTLVLMMSRRTWKHIEDFSAKNSLTLDAAIEEAILAIE